MEQHSSIYITEDKVDVVDVQCAMYNVPTSVPKSHFDITSYKEQTVNKEKDTSIGKETNEYEAF